MMLRLAVIMAFVATVLCNMTLKQQMKNELANRVTIELEIPFPAGIAISCTNGPEGEIYRFARLHYNAVRYRPRWTSVEVVRKAISRLEARMIVARTEAHVAAHGWSGGRHVDYGIRPTKDIVVRNIFSTDEQYETFTSALQDRLWPEFERVFGIDPLYLTIEDFFITKYDANVTTETGLAQHEDQGPFSFVVALNDEFTGGGTFFVDSQTLYKPPVGAAVIFSGKRTHGGQPITNGTRYIMAAFLDYAHGERVGIDANRQFMQFYDPHYDGNAGQFGLQSGDLIIGVETCSIDHNTQQIRQEMTTITTTTEDEEWLRAIRSCANLLPQGNARLLVKRFVDPILL